MRQIPQVDKLLRHPLLEAVQTTFRRDLLTVLIREELAELRASGDANLIVDLDVLAQMIRSKVDSLLGPGMRRVLNGTGVVLHTNLGRAPLSGKAIAALAELADGYVNLEIDLQTGERGQRSDKVSTLLRLITGAEDAVCVNNNAAAVVLCVNTFARDKEVVVSRGELIEIGGSFRLPEVITAGGARLKEVGTTNRTRAADYERAMTGDTKLIIRCHRSNFDITGFTEQPALAEIVEVGKKAQVPVLEDLGSGVLIDIEAISQFKTEPGIQEVLATGCDIVSFSGDKLLGGPQAGIIVGRKDWISLLSKNPLYRALRLDKVSLYLLEKTLTAYLGPSPQSHLPALAMLAEPASSIEARVQHFMQFFMRHLDPSQKDAFTLAVVACESAAGGGSLPGQHALSYGLKVQVSGLKSNRLALQLRRGDPAVVGLVKDGDFLIDFRTINQDDQESLRACLLAVSPKQQAASQRN
jgi:L-seryl-tRNA(Ser) seleniumtransferase